MNQYYEKYKPRTIKDIIGDERSTENIVSFLKNFKRMKKKCMIVSGNHGSGKKCRVKTILTELGYEPIQIDITKIKLEHKKDEIKEKNKKKKPNHSVIYLRNLINNVDLLSMDNLGNDDKIIPTKKVILFDGLDTELMLQEKKKLISIMKLNNENSLCPIIFIFDFKHNKLINMLKKSSFTVTIGKPTNDNLFELLCKICQGEKIKLKNMDVANKIIAFAQNDFRRLCITLHDIVSGLVENISGSKVITIEVVNNYIHVVSEKDISLDLFSSSSKLLSSYENIEECLKIYEIEKVHIPLMIHQNYISSISKYQKNLGNEKIMTITSALSYSDIVDNYIYGEQKWDISNVYGFFSCCVPSYILKGYKLPQYPKFPVDMNKTSNKKLNKKHILNAAQIFRTIRSIDYIYISKIITHMFKNNKLLEIKQIMNYYKLSLTNLEDILKINKTSKNKITLSAKQKKSLKEL